MTKLLTTGAFLPVEPSEGPGTASLTLYSWSPVEPSCPSTLPKTATYLGLATEPGGFVADYADKAHRC